MSIINYRKRIKHSIFFNIGIFVCTCEFFRECYALSSTLNNILIRLTLDNSSDARDNKLEIKFKYLGLVNLTVKSHMPLLMYLAALRLYTDQHSADLQ